MNVASFLFSCEIQQIVRVLCINGLLEHTALTDFTYANLSLSVGIVVAVLYLYCLNNLLSLFCGPVDHLMDI